jgi:hypothetical protein
MSASCGFTSDLPTNELRCIERFAASRDTARALRNEMKNSSAKIRAAQESEMKITTVVKASMVTVALGVAFLLPATAHAQSDMSPDEFPFSVPQATAAQPAQVVSAMLVKAEFEGRVSLPYDVKCGNTNLKAGEYLLAVKSEGMGRVVTINGSGANMKMRVHQVPANQTAGQSALLVRHSNEGRKLEAVYVEGLNATLYLEASTNGSHARMERLPIS